MNILIVGGAGFVGSNLVRRCLEDPANKVSVFDSLDPRFKSTAENLREVWNRIRFVHGTIEDERALSEIVPGQHVIYNCAAQASHTFSIQYPMVDAEINCLGNLKLLEAVRTFNKDAVLVYPSSTTVLGKINGECADESYMGKPLDIYSANKKAAEHYYYIYNQYHDLKTVVLRFPNLYGPYGKGYPDFGFVNYFIHLSWMDRDIEIFGSGEQKRNLLYVGDAVNLLYHAAQDERLYGDTFFAVHDEHRSVLEIARTIVAVLGRGNILHTAWPEERLRIEVENVRISGLRLQRTIGWRPAYSLEDGLRKTKEILEKSGVRKCES